MKDHVYRTGRTGGYRKRRPRCKVVKARPVLRVKKAKTLLELIHDLKPPFVGGLVTPSPPPASGGVRITPYYRLEVIQPSRSQMLVDMMARQVRQQLDRGAPAVDLVLDGRVVQGIHR